MLADLLLYLLAHQTLISSSLDIFAVCELIKTANLDDKLDRSLPTSEISDERIMCQAHVNLGSRNKVAVVFADFSI